MTRKTIHQLCFLFLTPLLGFSQTGLPNDIALTIIDETNGGLIPRRMIAARDGGFMIAGSDGLSGYLEKLSSCGKSLWKKHFRLGAATSLRSLTELPSGEIVAAGACTNCAPGDTTQKALVIRTDAQGSLLADTTLGRTGFNAQATDVLQTAAGMVAVCGQTVTAGGFSPSNGFLAVLDLQLTLGVWTELNHFFYDNINALTQTADGGFLLAGRSFQSIADPQKAQVFKTDAAGNMLWKYTSPHLNSVFTDVVQAPDGRVIALGDRYVNDLDNRDVFVAVLEDISGLLQEEKKYGSPADDGAKSLETLENGFLVGAIYGQPSQSGFSARNWVLRLSEQLEIEEEYFRDGFLFGHFLVNAVPICTDGRAFAYHARLIFFESHRVMFFKRTFPGQKTTLSKAPIHYQLFPRQLNANTATVSFQGTLSDASLYDTLHLDVQRDGTPWLTLIDPSPQTFDFTVQIPAELAEYSFRLTGLKNQTTCVEAEACDVVAGDAYLIQGQSNAVAALPFDPDNVVDHAYRHHTTPYVRNFGFKANAGNQMIWHKETGTPDDYADNLSGQWGLILGKQIADNHGIPVAILNGAIGGIALETMLPNPDNHADTNRTYGRFLTKVQASGLIDQLRAIIMFQGETNALPGAANPPEDYLQKFAILDNAWRTDFPSLEQRYLFQIRPGWFNWGATPHSCLQIAEAHRRIAAQLPDWRLMSTTGMNHDGLHYHYANGYERAGLDIYRLVDGDLYDTPEVGNIHPPVVSRLRFSNCTNEEITLELEKSLDTYHWTPGWEADFWLEGDSLTTVAGGAIVGNSVILQLSDQPGAGFSGLSYRSHPEGSEAPVKNANGIGMVMFYNLPLEAYPPVSLADTLLILDDGSGSGVLAVTPSGGTPPYQFAWSNGATTPEIDSLVAGFYQLTVTDNLGCSQSFVFDLSTVGAGDVFHTLDASLYPNPCTDALFLRGPALANWKNAVISVSDMGGRLLTPPVTALEDGWQVETAALSPGKYLVCLIGGKRILWQGWFLRN